jgi:hypothetical protein
MAQTAVVPLVSPRGLAVAFARDLQSLIRTELHMELSLTNSPNQIDNRSGYADLCFIENGRNTPIIRVCTVLREGGSATLVSFDNNFQLGEERKFFGLLRKEVDEMALLKGILRKIEGKYPETKIELFNLESTFLSKYTS